MYLYQLHQIFKEALFIDSELAIFVDDAVVLHLAVAAHTEGVVTREVGTFSYQKQACLWWVKQLLCLIPSYLPMKPSGSGEDSE